jgi:hypothetical protein
MRTPNSPKVSRADHRFHLKQPPNRAKSLTIEPAPNFEPDVHIPIPLSECEKHHGQLEADIGVGISTEFGSNPGGGTEVVVRDRGRFSPTPKDVGPPLKPLEALMKTLAPMKLAESGQKSVDIVSITRLQTNASQDGTAREITKYKVLVVRIVVPGLAQWLDVEVCGHKLGRVDAARWYFPGIDQENLDVYRSAAQQPVSVVERPEKRPGQGSDGKGGVVAS